MDERLKQQLDFALEIDKEKNIFRQTHLSGHGRNENDAEHAWHMAIMAYLLQEYANEPVDIGRVMLMCLIHDIVEIDAGDTYAYDTEGLKTQKAREDAAKERIFSLLPEDQKQKLTQLFDEFEEFQTPESKVCPRHGQPAAIAAEQQQRRRRLERTRRVGKAGLWQAAKDQTGLGEALPGDGSDSERAYPEGQSEGIEDKKKRQ